MCRPAVHHHHQRTVLVDTLYIKNVYLYLSLSTSHLCLCVSSHIRLLPETPRSRLKAVVGARSGGALGLRSGESCSSRSAT
jgi:hypothetical protein